MSIDINALRVAYEISKVVRRDPETLKMYTDRDFAREYLDCDFSMVTKVLRGKAVSKPTTDAVIKFILDSQQSIKKAVKSIDSLQKGV